jgi:hypothetical protein
VSEQEAEKQQLQDQLAAANQATDGSTASQSSPASDSTAASDANKALQEELAKLRQEVLYMGTFHNCIELQILHLVFIRKKCK